MQFQELLNHLEDADSQRSQKAYGFGGDYPRRHDQRFAR
jgi:hypothetical protein